MSPMHSFDPVDDDEPSIPILALQRPETPKRSMIKIGKKEEKVNSSIELLRKLSE